MTFSYCSERGRQERVDDKYIQATYNQWRGLISARHEVTAVVHPGPDPPGPNRDGRIFTCSRAPGLAYLSQLNRQLISYAVCPLTNAAGSQSHTTKGPGRPA